MKISLVLAYRDRPVHIENLFNSLEATTADIDNVEVILALDDDDKAGLERVNTLAKKFNNVISYITKRSEHFTKDYMNPIARMARGRWIININDDTVFVTRGWDTLIDAGMRTAADYVVGDDYWLGLVNDGMDRTGDDPLFPAFSCWPVLSRQAVQGLGYLFDERFKIWGVDHYVAHVYRELGRLVSLTHVSIDHNSLHARRRPKNELDTNHERFCRIDQAHGFKYTEQMVREEVAKIKGLIGHD